MSGCQWRNPGTLEDEPRGKVSVSRPRSSQLSRPMPKRILLVDDNRDVADALAALVEFEGHQARCAADGHEALLVAGSFLPELAFVDWKLPDMSGGELVGQLRLNPSLSNTRYVLLSGHIDPDIAARAAAAGFDKCLTKPVRFEDLLACL